MNGACYRPECRGAHSAQITKREFEDAFPDQRWPGYDALNEYVYDPTNPSIPIDDPDEFPPVAEDAAVRVSSPRQSATELRTRRR